MSVLLRSLLVLSVSGLLLAGCGEKAAEPAPAPAANPVVVPVAPVAPAAEASPATGGGYEPTAEERVPGITIPVDGAAPVDVAAPAAAPAETPAPAAEVPASK